MTDNTAAEEGKCEECRGSGEVAYGRWGSRPPRETCKECNGTGRQSVNSGAEARR